MIPYGWIGNLLIIGGTWQLAHKQRYALLITIAGGFFWLYEAYRIGRFDLMFVEAVMILITARNYWHWGRDARTTLGIHTGSDSEQPVPNGRVCPGCDCKCDRDLSRRAATDVEMD